MLLSVVNCQQPTLVLINRLDGHNHAILGDVFHDGGFIGCNEFRRHVVDVFDNDSYLKWHTCCSERSERKRHSPARSKTAASEALKLDP